MQEVTIYESREGFFRTAGEALISDFKCLRNDLDRQIMLLSVFRSKEQFRKAKDTFNLLYAKYEEYRTFAGTQKEEEMPKYVEIESNKLVDLEEPEQLRRAA